MIEKVAKDLIKDKNSDREEVFVDPLTISLAISLVRGGISLYKACKKTPKETATRLNNPGKLEELKIRQLVRKELGFFKFQQEGRKWIQRLEDKAKTITEDEVKQIYEQLD